MSADRAILHSDMNSFYASVEMMLDPKLRGKAVAVCGSTENRHGIVLAKSELAKRAGVKTGMVNWEAKQRCKDLILVPPQYDQYIWTEKVRAITIRAIDLIPQTTEEQLSLMVDYERRDRRVRLEDAIEDLRRRFGKKSLTYAGLLGNLKMPDDGRDSVKMPGLMYQ